MHGQKIPVCLSIAGSDSSGGAGIQADLKTFAYFKTFGVTVITAVTAQNPFEVSAIYPIPTSGIFSQFQAVTTKIKINAIKTGMLYSPDIIEGLANEFQTLPKNCPKIVDPVMVATSGSRLVKGQIKDSFQKRLAPRATLITPNIPEAEFLTGSPLSSREEMIRIAQDMSQNYQTRILIKGGHRCSTMVTDVYIDGATTYELKSPCVNALTTHGTGCILSSAITANLALGNDLLDALITAKAFIYHSLKNCVNIGASAFAIGLPDIIDTSIVKVEKL